MQDLQAHLIRELNKKFGIIADEYWENKTPQPLTQKVQPAQKYKVTKAESFENRSDISTFIAKTKCLAQLIQKCNKSIATLETMTDESENLFDQTIQELDETTDTWFPIFAHVDKDHLKNPAFLRFAKLIEATYATESATPAVNTAHPHANYKISIDVLYKIVQKPS